MRKNHLIILTIIFYNLIIFSSVHFGAPLFFIVLMGFGSGVLGILQSSAIVCTLIFFIYSYRNPKRTRDRYVFSIGGLILLIPIVEQTIWLHDFLMQSFFDDVAFSIPTLVFLFFLIATIISIFRFKGK